MTLKIGISAFDFSGNRTGIGRYAWELFIHLYEQMPDVIFYLYSNRHLEIPDTFTRVVMRDVSQSFYGKLPDHIWLKVFSRFSIKRDKLDLFWSPLPLYPNNCAPLNVVTVHDLHYILTPESLSWVDKCFSRWFFRKDVERADAVVCISDGTAKRLLDLVGVSSSAVVRPCVSDCFLSLAKKHSSECPSNLVNKPYLLLVATHQPNKNISVLISVFSELSRERKLGDRILIVVGGHGWKSNLTKLLNSTKTVTEKIQIIGYVTDELLCSYYYHADLFILPSFCEGYGMPVAEALTCHTDVVATDIPELRESGQNKCTYVSPSVDGIKEGILDALENKKRYLGYKPLLWQEESRKMVQLFYDLLPK